MAEHHNPDKPNRGYFKQSRVSKALPPLPPGYNWNKQIEKYSSKDTIDKFRTAALKSELFGITSRTRPAKEPNSKPVNWAETGRRYRTEVDDQNRYLAGSNFNTFSGVFCHRAFYDQAMKIPENSFLAIENGLRTYSFRLFELDVKLHTNADNSLNAYKAFISHDATGARTTAKRRRWSQDNYRDIIGTILVTKGINLENNDYASTFQETDATLSSLENLLLDYESSFWESCTFQLDVSQPGDAFAKLLAWFRYNRFRNLQVIIKGYNRSYLNGPALLDAVNRSLSLRTGALIDTFQTDGGAVFGAAWSSRRKIVMGSRDKWVRIWDCHSGTLEKSLVGHDDIVYAVAFSRSGATVLSGSKDTTVRVWDTDTGNLIHSLNGHKGAVNSVAFSHDDLLVASGSDDGKVLIWDTLSGKLRHVLKGHKNPVAAVAFPSACDHMWVASGSKDGTIRIFATRTGKLLQTLSGHTAEVTSIVIDANLMATSSFDKTVWIWNTSTWKLLHTLGGHDGGVTSIAFNATDMQLVSASDQMIHIWQAERGELQRTFQAHAAPITSVTFGTVRNTRTIITSSSNGEVRIWADRGPSVDQMVETPSSSMGIIMVFYPQPILDIALEEKGLTLETTSPEERLEILDYEYLTNTTRVHIMSFVDNPVPEFGQVIPEIVHCGLGLHYNRRCRTAVNPKDGSPISDPEVLLASRLDRAMIDVSLELRNLYPEMVFSSCTRLSDVYFSDSDAEYTADLMTGRLKPKLTEQHGIPARLRALHGGLYPQSDIVVADDPLAEIAARTWIDEYAQLDRTQLMTMTYDDWIAQDPAVKAVVDELNARFWPNTISRPKGSVQEVRDIVLTAGVQMQGREGDGKAKDMNTALKLEKEGKQRWWKKF